MLVMTRVLVLMFLAAATGGCNNGAGSDTASGDSAVLITPSAAGPITVTTKMDSAAVAPMTDTTTAGTGTAASGGSGLGTTGSGTTTPVDSVPK